MIRCVAVRNDVRLDGSGFGTLDPGLPGDHVFRCDQLLFLGKVLLDPKITQWRARTTKEGRPPSAFITGTLIRRRCIASSKWTNLLRLACDRRGNHLP